MSYYRKLDANKYEQVLIDVKGVEKELIDMGYKYQYSVNQTITNIDDNVTALSNLVTKLKKEIENHKQELIREQELKSLLALHGLEEGKVGRLRGSYFVNKEGSDSRDDNGDFFLVYTRTGGGNRAEYRDNWKYIRKNPNYLNDEDDEMDSTYANIWFTRVRPPPSSHC